MSLPGRFGRTSPCMMLIIYHILVVQKYLALTESKTTLKQVLGAVRVVALSINPFKPSIISHCYQLGQSISVLRDVGWYFSFLFKF